MIFTLLLEILSAGGAGEDYSECILHLQYLSLGWEDIYLIIRIFSGQKSLQQEVITKSEFDNEN